MATLPPPPATASVTPTFTITPTSTLTPTLTPSPIPTATWVAQGPGTINVPILLYHHVGISPVNSQYYVSPDKFEEQMKLLRDWEYTTITTEMLVKALTEGSALPPRPILITFDDGNLDNYTTAFPIMQKYGFTGVLYIVDNYIGADKYMSVYQIKEMASAGWEVGSHSGNHVDLTAIEMQRQRHEIVDSRMFLKKELGLPILTFAHPYGVSNHSVLNYAELSGYIAGMGLGITNNQYKDNIFALQRRGVKGMYDLKQFASLLSWQGDPIFLPTDTPAPTASPWRAPIPTYIFSP